jgi:hypothetical protein
MPEGEQPRDLPKPVKKGVLGSEQSGGSRKSFLRELKEAARGRLDKRSPQK